MQHHDRRPLAVELDRHAAHVNGSHEDRSTTSFSRTPIPSISMRTTSPAFRYFGGSKPMPTPAGVPVAITSPGCRRDAGGQGLDDGRNVEDQQAGIRALPELAIDVAARSACRRGRSRRASPPTAHRTERVLRFADQPLAIACLQVARRHVVDDGVAPDMIECVLAALMPRPPLPMMTASSAS